MTRDLIHELNRSMPAAAHAALGTNLETIATQFNALLAKLDADAGITDTDYAATLALKPLSEQ
jgi:hypothetical protein